MLDEIQALPQAFEALRVLIDEDRDRNGRFILLGSAHPALVRGVSETLTGRVALVDLAPLAKSGSDPVFLANIARCRTVPATG